MKLLGNVKEKAREETREVDTKYRDMVKEDGMRNTYILRVKNVRYIFRGKKEGIGREETERVWEKHCLLYLGSPWDAPCGAGFFNVQSISNMENLFTITF